MTKNKELYRFDSVDFITYVWSKRLPLLLLTLSAAVISAVASFLITPKFRSQVVMFPATSASISKTLLAQGSYNQDDNLKFGGEQESEQLMQILYSEEIKRTIIHKFNLVKHYKIDTASRFWRTKLNNEYEGNITFKRTEYMSIIIDVLDVNPDTAAFIANEISCQVDSVITQIKSQRARKSMAIVENEYIQAKGEINKLQDSLRLIQECGVMDYKSQSKAFSSAYAVALADGRLEGAKRVESKMKIVARYAAINASLTKLLESETERLSSLKAKYTEARVDAEQSIPHKFVIDKAFPSEKKAYPKRLLIVLISSVSAFLVALLFFIILDSVTYKKSN